MKITFNFDNDIVVAMATLMGIKGEDKDKMKAFLAENESVEASASELGDEGETAVNAILMAVVLKKMEEKKNEGK